MINKVRTAWKEQRGKLDSLLLSMRFLIGTLNDSLEGLDEFKITAVAGPFITGGHALKLAMLLFGSSGRNELVLFLFLRLAPLVLAANN